MDSELDLWRLFAGLGLFLFGMHMLERALKQLAGRPFKKFLRNSTARPTLGVLAGAISTAALQSSSVVSLIVLAFVGAGIISLASALGIVFGSNLGTTATGWIVATIGFKLDIEAVALPFVALGGFGIVWSRAGSRRAGFSQMITGFGLMLMGLEFMKSGAIAATAYFDPDALAGYPLIVFLGAGFLITAIIQSSSATIMITLSALYAGAITLPAAAAIAIGADLGTTITALLGALAGSSDKKRVAAAIILFNVVADAMAFAFLHPLLSFINNGLHIKDPLFSLVAFHSLFNFIGIAVFLPLVGPLSGWLSRHFRRHANSVLRHLDTDSRAVPDIAIENARRETARLIDQVAALNQASLHVAPQFTFYDSAADRTGMELFNATPDLDSCYVQVKQLEGAILEYALALQSETLEPEESVRLGQVIPAIRNAVNSAKSIRDVRHDLEGSRESVNDRFNDYASEFRDGAREFYEAMSDLQQTDLHPLRFEVLVALKNKSEDLHERLHQRIHADVASAALSKVEISTLLNVNREFYISNRSLISALADTVLDPDAAEDFESIPATH